MRICNNGLDLVPIKISFSRHNQPWITGHVKRLSRRKQRAYNWARETNNPHDWSKYYAIKKECQFECRAAYNKYVHDLIDPNSDIITKRLWVYIKSKKQDHTGIGALNYQGNTYTDSKDKANLFADCFSSVFSHEDTSHTPELDGAPLPSISPLQIHVDGVYHLLQNINIHKATGPDNLPARFLNEVAREIAPALTVIFQASLNQETLPSIWKSAAVVPIFKKGSRSDPCNFRPISLTCICVKILEHIVFSHISHHLETQSSV